MENIQIRTHGTVGVNVIRNNDKTKRVFVENWLNRFYNRFLMKYLMVILDQRFIEFTLYLNKCTTSDTVFIQLSSECQYYSIWSESRTKDFWQFFFFIDSIRLNLFTDNKDGRIWAKPRKKSDLVHNLCSRSLLYVLRCLHTQYTYTKYNRSMWIARQ